MIDGPLTPKAGNRRSWRTPVGMVVGALALAGAVALWGPGLFGPDEAVHPAARFLIAVAAVLLVCHLCGELLRRWHQPPVLGEILGGLLLGPSALGLAWPAAQEWLFPADVLVHLDLAAQLGLVIFMFLLGCELRTEDLRGPRVLSSVVAGSMGLPFLAGVGVAVLAGGSLAGDGADRTSYVLFFGLALAITALPVLGRILVDLRMERTPIGAITLSAAAIGDGLAWTALAMILTAATSGSEGWLRTAGLAVAFVLFVVLCVRPALAALERYTTRRRRRRNNGSDDGDGDGENGHQVLLAILVVGAIGCGAVTEVIGLHAVLGAFLFGTAVPRRSAVVHQISRRMQGFAIAILLPLFFAGVGLKTSIGLLGGDPTQWLVLLGVLLAAVTTKIVGAGGGARLAGLPGPQALQVGTLMNCRGITELVVATIGLQSGLISPRGFTILVLVAVSTTAVTGPLMRVFLARDARRAAETTESHLTTPNGRTRME